MSITASGQLSEATPDGEAKGYGANGRNFEWQEYRVRRRLLEGHRTNHDARVVPEEAIRSVHEPEYVVGDAQQGDRENDRDSRA